jgi:hypothetical protein
MRVGNAALPLLNLATGAKQPPGPEAVRAQSVLVTGRDAHRGRGQRAAWQADDAQIGMFDLRSGSLHRLTHSEALDEFPAWSSNGRRDRLLAVTRCSPLHGDLAHECGRRR